MILKETVSTAPSPTTSTARPTNSTNTPPTPAAWRSGTYSLRAWRRPTSRACGWPGTKLGLETKIFTRTVANPESRTVDYHCAWDQGLHLWMIHLMRVVDAQVVPNKPIGCAVDELPPPALTTTNAYPETAPPERARVGR